MTKVSSQPINDEPRLALWCHANPDLAAARIEELEGALRAVMDASNCPYEVARAAVNPKAGS